MRYVPEPWHFALLALAAFRTWKLLGDDTILDRPRHWVRNWKPSTRGLYWYEFLACPWCLGSWCAGAWWLAWIIFPTEALYAAVSFAIMAAVGLIGSVWNEVSE